VSEIGGNDSATTVQFSGTDNSKFYAAVLGRNRGAIEKVFGSGLQSLVGKRIQVKGNVVLYRRAPEIVVSSADQITVADDAHPDDAMSKPADRGSKLIDASDAAAVVAALPKEVPVLGKVEEITAKGDVLALRFAGTEKSHFNAVVLKRNREVLEKVYGDGL